MLCAPRFIHDPVLGPCEVLSRGHFPDTVIVRDGLGNEYETQFNQFIYQQDHHETDKNI